MIDNQEYWKNKMAVCGHQACYRRAQTFKHSNIQTFKHWW
jgi:hypothetical protein